MITKLLKEQNLDDSFPTFRAKDFQNLNLPTSRPQFLRGRKKYKFSDSQIRNLVDHNVIEVVFKRRGWPLKDKIVGHRKPYRRMLCTANWKFVNREASFKFVAPLGVRSRTKSWYKRKKLVIVWDLLRLDWRLISLDDYEIKQIYPTSTRKQQNEFVSYWKNMLKRWGRLKMRKLFDK